MADINIEQTQEQTVAQTQTLNPEIPAELQRQMDISLNYNKPDFKPMEIPAASIENNAAQAEVVTDIPFQFSSFKDKFGFEKADDIFKEIEDYRVLKAAPPPVAAELKFENDYNKNLFEAIRTGKINEVYSALDEQIKLERFTTSEVTKDTAEDIIKLGMQMEFKNLTADEIAYQYKQQYKIPKEPKQTDDEEDPEFEERKAEWDETVQDVQMRKIIAAKMAIPKLETAKSKIALPNIESAVDPQYQEYLQYLKDLEAEDKIDAETKNAYKSFTSKDIETKMNFNDAANKIAFDFQYEPDNQGFSKTIELVSTPNKFYELYKNPDGTHNRKKFLEDVHFSLNREQIIMEAMKQAKNATLKSMLPDNSSGTGLNRQTIQREETKTELEKEMERALGRYMPQNGRLQPQTN